MQFIVQKIFHHLDTQQIFYNINIHTFVCAFKAVRKMCKYKLDIKNKTHYFKNISHTNSLLKNCNIQVSTTLTRW